MVRLFFLSIIGAVCFFVPGGASAAYVLGQTTTFTVDPGFDTQAREQVSATLQKVSDRLYFYVEDEWWNSLSQRERDRAFEELQEIANRFNSITYAILRNVFGSENRPGVDQDERITVLLHEMKNAAGGYVRTADGYTKLEAPTSNEREMFYISVDKIEDAFVDSLFAHEFMHLILFQQRERASGLQDDVWFQEGMAEVAATIAGYNDTFSGSYLQKRTQEFLRDPRDSLTEWRNKPVDYGVASMFFHYILDRYGQQTVVDIMRSEQVGMRAFEDALAKNGFNKSFSDVFEDWTVALFLNDCSHGVDYCYSRAGLSGMKVVPLTNFLSALGDSELRVTNLTKGWAGNWSRVVGGHGTLHLEFSGSSAVRFRVPYVLENTDGSFSLRFLRLDEQQGDAVVVEGFGSGVRAFIMIPFVQRAQRTFGSSEPSHFFTWTASTSNERSREESEETKLTELQIQAILNLLHSFQARQEVFEKVEAALRDTLPASPSASSTPLSSFSPEIPIEFSFTQNLRQGDMGHEVRYLQVLLNANIDTRLATSGPGSSGNETQVFGPLTRRAVIRFQEKYAADILHPLGLNKGTGFVGPATRGKIKEIMERNAQGLTLSESGV